MASKVVSTGHKTRVDLSGVLLLIIGLLSGTLAYVMITSGGVNPLVLVPSVVAATLGATSMTKREAPRG